MKFGLALLILLASITIADAISPEDQIILFGGNSRVNGAPTTACNAGQLDFSDATGCNLTFFR